MAFSILLSLPSLFPFDIFPRNTLMEQCVSLYVHIMVEVRNVFVKMWKAAVIPFTLIYLQKMLLLGAPITGR